MNLTGEAHSESSRWDDWSPEVWRTPPATTLPVKRK